MRDLREWDILVIMGVGTQVGGGCSDKQSRGLPRPGDCPQGKSAKKAASNTLPRVCGVP